jgi:hypothetical protein
MSFIHSLRASNAMVTDSLTAGCSVRDWTHRNEELIKIVRERESLWHTSGGVMSCALEGSINSLESLNIFVLRMDKVSKCRKCMRINKGSISNLIVERIHSKVCR